MPESGKISNAVGDLAHSALAMHARYRGKIQTQSKVPVNDLRDLAIWYTPGVAEPCRAIVAEPDSAFAYTNRGNTIAIVSDGSRVLGLGDIGPEAGLPVMEGKALLFKLFGGVDAVPLCIRVRDAGVLWWDKSRRHFTAEVFCRARRSASAGLHSCLA